MFNLKLLDFYKSGVNPIKLFAFVICVFLAAAIQGAIPFLSITTLGQSSVVVGYPISFLNQEGFSIFANNMGYPQLAPMSTMLAPSLLMQLMLSVGFSPVDSFNFSFLLFLIFGFWGAFSICNMIGLKFFMSILFSLLWFFCPIVWVSSGYSHLHFGFVLFPGLIFSLLLLLRDLESNRPVHGAILFYVSSVFVAAFTDGYTFIFFATSSSVIVIFYSFKVFSLVSKKVGILCLVHFFSFLLAYASYALYIGKSEFSPAQLDFFRGWGVDILYLIVPTEGVHWFWDFWGLSVPRSGIDHFGDASVWTSTFILPIMLPAVIGVFLSKNKLTLARAFIVIAIIGLYMALGPSLKFNSLKPSKMGPAMSEEQAVVPTGTGIISKHVPGLRSMRAAYRWIFLAFFSCWALLAIYLANRIDAEKKGNSLLIIVLLVMFSPNLSSNLKQHMEFYQGFLGIDDQLVGALGDDLNKGEVVAFLPPGNDFLVNYLAPSLDVFAYNIGGDKNVAAARIKWPETMKFFSFNTISEDFTDRMLLLLVRGEVDVVVLPFIDLLWAAHQWPPSNVDRERFNEVLGELQQSSVVDIDEGQYYAVVRLRPEFNNVHSRKVLERTLIANSCLTPYCMEANGFNPKILSQAGSVSDGQIFSKGEEGLIHYGPYSALVRGNYVLEIIGQTKDADGAWVDLVSNRGQVEHAKFDFPVDSKKGATLVRRVVSLEHDVDDLEVRIFSGQGDYIVLSSYSVFPVKGQKIGD